MAPPPTRKGLKISFFRKHPVYGVYFSCPPILLPGGQKPYDAIRKSACVRRKKRGVNRAGLIQASAGTVSAHVSTVVRMALSPYDVIVTLFRVNVTK